MSAAVSGRVTVVTAVHAPSARFLPEAYRSLCGQRLPEGWDWQWLIQEDGSRRRLEKEESTRMTSPTMTRSAHSSGP